MRSSTQQYADNGVVLSKALLAVGDEILISYSGLLAQSGADQVFAHVGYGEGWEDKTFLVMDNDNGTFKAKIKVQFPGELNISFKDSANNWDNNSSNNYSFKVSEKEKSSKSSAKTSEPKKTAVKEKSSAQKSPAKTADAKKIDTKAADAKKTAVTAKTAASNAKTTAATAKKTVAKEKTATKKK